MLRPRFKWKSRKKFNSHLQLHTKTQDELNSITTCSVNRLLFYYSSFLRKDSLSMTENTLQHVAYYSSTLWRCWSYIPQNKVTGVFLVKQTHTHTKEKKPKQLLLPISLPLPPSWMLHRIMLLSEATATILSLSPWGPPTTLALRATRSIVQSR